MDPNEFSFGALFNCADFRFSESLAFKEAFAELNNILETELCKSDLRSRLDNAANRCIFEARSDAFKQGFCFAVKSIKFLLKI
ncbi:MAG: hypothetical protein K2J73_10350 [Oscillospiraceae bacterium]|nr:hypothetical protein [Oscillospiraceae bacterium]